MNYINRIFGSKENNEFKIEEFDTLDPSGKSGILIHPKGGEHTISYKGKELDKESVCKFIERVTGLHQNLISELTKQDLVAKLDSLKQRNYGIPTGRQKFHDKTQKVAANVTAALQLPFEHFNKLSNKELSKIPASVFKWREPEFYAGLDARVLNNLSDGALKHLDAAVLNNLSNGTLKGLNALVLNNLSGEALKGLDARVLNNLSDKALRGLNARNLSTFDDDDLIFFDEHEHVLNNLSDKTLANLDARVLNLFYWRCLSFLDARILNNLSDKALEGLSADVLNSLSKETLKGLGPRVLNKLSDETVKNLNKIYSYAVTFILNTLSDKTIKGLDASFYNKLDYRAVQQAPSSVFEKREESFYKNLQPCVLNALEEQALKEIPEDIFKGRHSDFYSGLNNIVLKKVPPSVIGDLAKVVMDYPKTSEAVAAANAILKWNLPDNDPHYLNAITYLTGLDAHALNSLSDETLKVLDARVSHCLSKEVFKDLDARVLNKLSNETLEGLDALVLNNISDEVLKDLDAHVLNNLSNKTLKVLDARVLNNSNKAFNGLDDRVLNNLSDEALQGLDPRVLNNLSDKTLDRLDVRVLNNLSDKTIEGLDARVLNKLDCYGTLRHLNAHVLNNLSDKTLKGLGFHVLHHLSDEKLKGVDARVLNNLSDKALEDFSFGLLEHLSDEALKGIDAMFYNKLSEFSLENTPPSAFEKREEAFYKNLQPRVFNTLNEQALNVIPEDNFKGHNSDFYSGLKANALKKVPLSVIDDLMEVVRSTPNKADAAAAANAILKWDLPNNDQRYLDVVRYLQGLDAHVLNNLSDMTLEVLDARVLRNLSNEMLKALEVTFYNKLSEDSLKNVPSSVFENRKESFYKNLQPRVFNALDKQILHVIPSSVVDNLVEVVRSSPNRSDATAAAETIRRWGLPDHDERYIDAQICLEVAQLASKKNPYTVHEKLLKNLQCPLLSFGKTHKRQILTQAIAENSSSTPATIEEVKKTLNSPLPTLNQMQNLYKNLTQKEAAVKESKILESRMLGSKLVETTLEDCKSACIEDPYITGFYQLFTGADETPVGRTAFQFATVMKHILSLDNNASKNELSLQEECFLNFMNSMLFCRTGKADGITMFYQSLKREEGGSSIILSGQTEALRLHKLVEQSLTESITDDLVRAICKMGKKEPFSQGVHQTQFLYNCLLPRVGLKVDLNYDRHAGAILDPLIKLLDSEEKMSDAVQILGEHFTPLLFKKLKETLGGLIDTYKKEISALEATQEEIKQLKSSDEKINRIQQQLEKTSERIARSESSSDIRAAMEEQRKLRPELDQAIANNAGLQAAIKKQEEQEAKVEATLDTLSEYGWEAKEEILSPEEEIDLLLQKVGYLDKK